MTTTPAQPTTTTKHDAAPPRAYPRLKWNAKTGAEITVHSADEEKDEDGKGFTLDAPKPPDPGLPGGPVKVSGDLTFQPPTKG